MMGISQCPTSPPPLASNNRTEKEIAEKKRLTSRRPRPLAGTLPSSLRKVAAGIAESPASPSLFAQLRNDREKQDTSCGVPTVHPKRDNCKHRPYNATTGSNNRHRRTRLHELNTSQFHTLSPDRMAHNVDVGTSKSSVTLRIINLI